MKKRQQKKMAKKYLNHVQDELTLKILLGTDEFNIRRINSYHKLLCKAFEEGEYYFPQNYKNLPNC